MRGLIRFLFLLVLVSTNTYAGSYVKVEPNYGNWMWYERATRGDTAYPTSQALIDTFPKTNDPMCQPNNYRDESSWECGDWNRTGILNSECHNIQQQTSFFANAYPEPKCFTSNWSNFLVITKERQITCPAGSDFAFGANVGGPHWATEGSGCYAYTCGCNQYRDTDGSCKPADKNPSYKWVPGGIIRYSDYTDLESKSCYSWLQNKLERCDLIGNPVACKSGEKFHTENFVSASEGLALSRRYRSGINGEAGIAFAVSSLVGLSTAWQSGNKQIVGLTFADGRKLYYAGTANGVLYSASKKEGALQQINDVWQLTQNDGTKWEFSNGLLSKETRRNGSVINFTYNNEKLTSLSSSRNRTLQLAYNANNQLQSLTEPSGSITTFEYNSNGQLTSVIYPDSTPAIASDNPRKQFLYEDARFMDALTGIVDENNSRFATYSYDANKRVIAEEHAGGANKSTFEYLNDQTTLVATYTNATTYQETLYSFTDINGGTHFTDTENMPCAGCSVGIERKEFDGGLLSKLTDRKGQITTYHYDNDGHEIERTEAVGTSTERTIVTTWDNTLNLPLTVTQGNHVTTYTYDAAGLVTSITQSDAVSGSQQTTTYTYTNGLVTQIDGPRTDVSDITTYTYDAQGNVSTITNAKGHVTQITAYNANGKPLTIIDPNGLQTTLTYTPRGWLKTRTVGTLVTTFDYDNVGQLTKVTLPDASFIAYEYDNAHRLTTIKNKAGDKIVYTLDYAGNRTKEEIFNASGTKVYSHGRNFNALNQLIEELNAQNQITTRYGYDANGQLTGQQRELDGLSQATNAQTYDALNRLSKITDALNGVTDLAYDTQDNLTGVTDPKRLNTGYEVDGLGQLKQTTSPDTGATSQTFDSAGNLKTSTNANGKTTTYSYDVLNRVTQIKYADNSTVTFTYDTLTTSNFGKGRLSKIVDTSGNTTFVYNQRGQLTTKTQTISGRARVHKYGYDSYGRVSTNTLPSGKVVKYVYNSNGQISSLQVAGVNQLTSITYQPFGGVKSFNYANGKRFNRTFDLDGRLDSFTLANQTVSVGYDRASRITSLGNQTYQYDALDRLTSANGLSYAYDANGNRLSLNSNSYTISTSSNRVTDVNAQAYQYDAAGNITNDGTNTFTFNAANRLSKAQSATATGDYVYNGLGQRVKKTVVQNGVTTTVLFAYDEAGRIVGTYNADGSLVQEIVWFGDIPVVAITLTGNHFIHSDHLNTPREISNANGTTVWKWENTDPFGANAANDDPDGDGTRYIFNHRFAGQIYDAETGLHQNYYRDYSPQLGRYVESDPIGLKGGINTYTYVNNAPLLHVDPWGLYPARWCTITDRLLLRCPDVNSWEEEVDTWWESKKESFCNKPCDAMETSCKRAMGPGCYLAGTPCLTPCEMLKQKCEAFQKEKCVDEDCEKKK